MYGLVRFFSFLIFISTTVSGKGKFFEPCFKDDIGCLSTATEKFLESTCNGIPDYDIKPRVYYPLIIPELEIVVNDETGLLFKLTNVNVTGLKKMQISYFKMDTGNKSVVLKTKVTLNIVFDLNNNITKKTNSLNGLYTATATALETLNYGYSLVKKGDDEYFEVGPETNTCEIIGEPNVSIQDESHNALINDQEATQLKPFYNKKKVHLSKQALCKIVESAYTIVIHNIRTVGRILPKGAFFKSM